MEKISTQIYRLLSAFLRQYFWTLLLVISVLYVYISTAFVFFLYFILPIIIVANGVFTLICFLINKIFRLEVLIALFVVALLMFIHIYTNEDYFVDYRDKIIFDGVEPQNKSDFYIGSNIREILFSLFLFLINLVYCIFFGKNKFYSV
ncbi:hypothetical protein [Capnocytophaga sp.]|uniref:hypothetical protein n=1 Tax=Capnocytophaga sp. TaxID=44737 RepID=UPI0026DC126D|nr:hypothetical protein [Capnocytophaga sp.]MDO5106355.1 hypothetical protein [Capnocytophaga sp.]